MKRYLLLSAMLVAANSLSAQTVANLVATGTSIKWYAAATGVTALASATPLVNATTYYASQTVNGVESTARFAVTATVNPLPVPTFIAQPGATANTATNVTYTTESGKTNYIWTYPGTLTTDYTITSGGGNTNSVTLKYVTTGIKTVTIKYSANGCTAASATSSTATTVASSLLAIGNTYQGGNIFYLLVSGDSGFDSNVQHGLIEPGYDQAANTENIKWSTYPAGVNLPITSEIGTGMQNTNWLIMAYGSSAQAANICKNLVVGGYSDWYLPSMNELQQLYYYKITGHSNFSGSSYISSTSLSIDYALAISFNITYFQATTAFKGNLRCNIRAIRSF